ncbi:hypothetical protein DPMN_118565 [Dreissena polymorpha]|uniref:Uncharacterized protein n=1 Tax=Dreissena polymorpha TaxID=45954 RepID=A0A9D4GNC0_DREPO|nr:hypothetical protein DPMN_118565 [Dreissena polymorpha]
MRYDDHGLKYQTVRCGEHVLNNLTFPSIDFLKNQIVRCGDHGWNKVLTPNNAMW